MPVIIQEEAFHPVYKLTIHQPLNVLCAWIPEKWQQILKCSIKTMFLYEINKIKEIWESQKLPVISLLVILN